ncbi:MAG: acetoin dehydrogenase dihydrolipoyllysine-residue acetyltransferase subunit [Alphaproteobacteria bacterium]|nr:acetoin dehydrogenase dihydrolipoyllysine-residue acetyltransferase subunit [Alphaproteobacteria bacterium]
MSADAITPIRMPKWGLSMQEGTIVSWAKAEGEDIREGDELVDVETTKITNVFEAPTGGVLRRIVAQPGDTLPVGALMAVLAAPSVADSAIDAFVADFNAAFVPGADEDGDAGLDTREIDAGGATLRVGVVGAEKGGTPAVLLHGFGGDLENWTLTMGPLAEERAVYAIELPGHGQSQKAIPDATVAGVAKTIAAALDALGVERAHLVGHSFGGAVALALALEAPDRAASLSLIASAGLPGTKVSADYIDGFIAARRARDLQPVAEMLFADKALATKELVEQLSRYKRIDGVEDALAALRHTMLETDAFSRLAARVGEVRAPLLVIYAENDEIVTGLDLAALPHTAETVALQSGHLPQIEAADAVVEALRRRMA